jgi:uncharacterized iron-regulated membrane protein
MRPIFTLLHRWAGLTIAGFLFVSGLTGAIISWDHELDDLLNARLTQVQSRGPFLSSLDLARSIEARDPRARVTYVPLEAEPGEALAFGVDPTVDPATGQLYELGYNQVFIDPVSGAELGRRNWGAAWPVTRENFVSFLYVLHYSLHIPALWGIDRWGVWLLGGVAMLWMLDSFVGFYLTLPARSKAQRREPSARGMGSRGWWARWAPAWRIKTSGSIWRVNFDIHRAFGLWTWGFLFMLAFTAFSLNLYSEIFYPLMSKLSNVTPSPFQTRPETRPEQPITPVLDYSSVIGKARAEAGRRGWAEPVGDAFYAQNHGIYGVRFFPPGGDHGAAGVSPAALYFDSSDGRYLGDLQPWKGTAADIFLQLQFPLHSGRILGVPGRILVSAMGIVTAALSVTGVVIWWRKRAAQFRRRASKEGAFGAHVSRPTRPVHPIQSAGPIGSD